jgi:cardiolipin synthase
MIINNWKKDLLTIPNLLSLFRLVLIPVYVIIYIHATDSADYFVAGAILAVSCLTDLFDGKIARHFNMVSTTGKILDPLADKATQFTLIVCLTIRYPILLALVLLFVAKEGFQLVAGFLTLRKGQMLTGALLTGKICTTILFISLIVLVLFPEIGDTAVIAITVVDCFFMLLSFMAYVRAYLSHSPMIQKLSEHENFKTE